MKMKSRKIPKEDVLQKNGPTANGNEIPAKKPIRRIKSVSDALHLVGASFHNIIHRHHPQLEKNGSKSIPNVSREDSIYKAGSEDVITITVTPSSDIFEEEKEIDKVMEFHTKDSSSEADGSPHPSAPRRRHSNKPKPEATFSANPWVEAVLVDSNVEEAPLSISQPLKSSLNSDNKQNSNISSKKLRKGISFHEDDVPETDEDEKDSDFESEGSALKIKTKKSSYRRKNSTAPNKAFIRNIIPPPVTSDPHQVHRNVDDLLFDMFQEKEEEVVLVGNFLAALEKTGLRKNDPRLNELFANLKQVHRDLELQFPKRPLGSVETLRLNRADFKKVIADNIVLISRAFRQQFIIPEFQQFCKHIEDIYEKCKKVTSGKQASYIPQLARVSPNYWGVSICTIDGQRHSIGDTTVPFTLQSCSKPLTYAIALNELGEETVHQYVGQEPSGRMFNELVLDYNNKPHNPMVNAGAIIVISLLKTMVRPELTLAEKFDYTLQYFKRLGGGEYLGFNNAVFLSEREAADRNYALGFYMREHKCFPEGTNLKECMDYYFQVCSMETNCEATSVMAATLANGGICPVSGEKVLKSDSVRDVLSLMHSCGMYDYSGQFAFKVGLPAKSGVSGCVILVVPNVLGMCIWSPPLDSLGNSVRGVTFCQELVEAFNFHKYDNLRHASHKIDPRRHRYETKGLNIVNLLFAAASGDVTSMRRLHLSGMDMSAMDYDGRTAVHLAAAEGHLECVEYLLRHCAVSHKPRDRWGHLPLDDAERFGHENVAEFLKSWDTEGDGSQSSSAA